MTQNGPKIDQEWHKIDLKWLKIDPEWHKWIQNSLKMDQKWTIQSQTVFLTIDLVNFIEIWVYFSSFRLIRPVGNSTDRLTVKMGLKLSQIIGVDMKRQILITNVWLEQEWLDYKLKWNPADYGNVRHLHVPSQHIWLPDIVLYNKWVDSLSKSRCPKYFHTLSEILKFCPKNLILQQNQKCFEFLC